MTWGFYGRSVEQDRLNAALGHRRFFFIKISGRRRIGKTALIQQALRAAGRTEIFYCQVPDSGPAGVLSAVADAMDTFALPKDRFGRPSTFAQLASLVGKLCRAGYVVALDEFQYFNRERLREFTSLLQAEVDELLRDAANVPGGIIVLGSLFTDLSAVLDARDAPLFGRVTHELPIEHWDGAALKQMLEAHGGFDPARLLFLWTLFEGVPKFYRDLYEQDVLGAPRANLLETMFFRSSSPLRYEAENWFLKELHGRYDSVLKYLAKHAGATHGEIVGHVRETSRESDEQIGGHLHVLADRYRMISKRLPVFAKPKARRSRYYISDNFLQAWLSCLGPEVAAANFRPVAALVAAADARLAVAEGRAFEKLVGQLHEERSRKAIGDFPLSRKLDGYWDSSDTEVDLVALDEPGRRIRLGMCKRDAQRLLADRDEMRAHGDRFLEAHPQFKDWTVERAAFAPKLDAEYRVRLVAAGFVPIDLTDLFEGL